LQHLQHHVLDALCGAIVTLPPTWPDSSYRTDLKEFLLDWLDFIEGKLNEACADPTSQKGAMVEAGGEYRYSDYGTWRTVLGNPATLAVTSDIRMRTHTALFGLAYTFMGVSQ
jgi:hypothetical protein